MAMWSAGSEEVLLVMAADPHEGTVGDAQVVAVDHRLWQEYLYREEGR